MRTRIKFCGITNLDDARAAIALGVDALGFVFHAPSPRYVTPADAAAIIAQLPPFVSMVGLFVNVSNEEVRATVSRTGIDAVQFHGDETPVECARAPCRWIKAIRAHPHLDLGAAARAYVGASAILLDSWDEVVFGGSGRTFDWSRVPDALGAPLILAGGLNAANVAEAVRLTRPYAVDVSGGIEVAKGRKDHEKMTRFVSEVMNIECHA